MKVMRSLTGLMVVFALLLGAVHPVLAQIPIPGPPKSGEGEEQKGSLLDKLQLLQPIRNQLSGSTWLIAKGVDNRALIEGESFLSPEGPNLAAADSPLNVSPSSPVLQASGAGVLVPYRNPAPAFSRNLLVTRDFSGRTLQTEPSLAVNPQDPDHLVLGTIDYNFPSNSVYVSIDGGMSWEGPKQTKYLRDDLGSGGDPVLAFDNKNNVFITSISMGVKDYSIGSAGGEALVSSIAVAASNDGGFTWNEPVSSARSEIKTDLRLDSSGHVQGTISFGFLDKPWIAVGAHPTIEDQEMIYVTYTEFVTRYNILYIGDLPVLGVPETLTTPKLVSSSDGGQTWSDPVAVGPTVRSTIGEGSNSEQEGGPINQAHPDNTPVIAGDDAAYRTKVLAAVPQQSESEGEGKKRVIQGPVPVVDSKGIVYVTWLDSTDDDSMKGLGELYMARSDDGGAKFDKPVRIASFLEIPFRPRNAFFRYWSSAFPKAAVGSKDELYVVYSALPPENPYDEGDIFFIRSTDGGKRWSRPKRLNQDETSAAQFFPALTVAPNGKIHVMWGDMRDDPIGTRYHIYYTSSENQGESWGFENKELGLQVPDTRVTDFPTNPNKAFPSGEFIGDYFAISATDKDVYMVWPDGRLGEYGSINQKIAFARQRAVPSPEIFLSPDTGPGGETITVQGHGFQPNLNYYLQVGGSTVSAGRSNDDGVITANVFVPISGEGAHQVSLVDDSGNVAATSFYMDFGFDNIQASLNALNKELDQLNGGSPITATQTSGAVTTSRNKTPTVKASKAVTATQPATTTQGLTETQPMSGTPGITTTQSVSGTSRLPNQPILASGFAASGADLPWGLAGIGGLLLGTVFTYVNMTIRRQRD